jgi:hypothetical protein
MLDLVVGAPGQAIAAAFRKCAKSDALNRTLTISVFFSCTTYVAYSPCAYARETVCANVIQTTPTFMFQGHCPKMRPNLPPRNRVARGGNSCDFCGAAFVARFYACRNFEWDGRPVFTRPSTSGRWAACDECARLIDADSWSRLHRRVMREVRKRKGLTVVELDYLHTDLRLLYAAVKQNIVSGESLTVWQSRYERVAEGAA